MTEDPLSDPPPCHNAAIVRAGDVVFSLQDNGELIVFRGGPTAFESVRRYKVAESETWTQPAISV